MVTVVVIVAGVGIAGLRAAGVQQEPVYYYSPTDRPGRCRRAFRVGGQLRTAASASAGQPRCAFQPTDYNKEIGVSYTGVLPDLFREGRAWSPAASSVVTASSCEVLAARRAHALRSAAQTAHGSRRGADFGGRQPGTT
jgi:hypothetical protein